MKPTALISTDTEGRPVRITVRGEQYVTDMDPDATELVADGFLTETAEGLSFAYQESRATGMEGTTTTFAIRGRQVILTRAGSVNSQMVFEQGRQHTSLYETPYGEMTVDIDTDFLEHTMTAQGGDMEIRYTIAMAHTVTGRNCFRICVKQKEDKNTTDE